KRPAYPSDATGRTADVRTPDPAPGWPAGAAAGRWLTVPARWAAAVAPCAAAALVLPRPDPTATTPSRGNIIRSARTKVPSQRERGPGRRGRLVITSTTGPTP